MVLPKPFEEIDEFQAASSDNDSSDEELSSGIFKKSLFTTETKEANVAKLNEIHLKRNEARKLNHKEVVEEDRLKKLPQNFETQRKRAEWILNDEENKKESGENWKQVKLLDVQADESERLDRRRKRKNPNMGFSTYEDVSFRQYQRLTRQMHPDYEEYELHKAQVGSDGTPNANTLYHGTHKPTEEAIERMHKDLQKQIEKKKKYHRRRAHNEDANIDYINEKNAIFNRKIDHFYGKYTAEIKQNLERGTAV